jgi:3-dehydrosphinganine reductase
MNQKNYSGKIAVITGGSSGIGLALAKLLRSEGAILVLIARDKHKLDTASMMLQSIPGNGAPVDIFVADVSNAQQITDTMATIGIKYGKIDLLVNSAGRTVCGRFAEQKPRDMEQCMHTNYLGAVYASQAAWPLLKAAGGQLSFVSSVAGYLGLYGYTGYAPTKFALTGLAECLRMEAKEDNIRISVIYPPDTDTPLLQYEHEHTLPECRALSGNIKVKTADAVAAAYLRGLQKGHFEIYCDAESRLLRWFKNNFPGFAYRISMRIIAKSRKAK